MALRARVVVGGALSAPSPLLAALAARPLEPDLDEALDLVDVSEAPPGVELLPHPAEQVFGRAFKPFPHDPNVFRWTPAGREGERAQRRLHAKHWWLEEDALAHAS